MPYIKLKEIRKSYIQQSKTYTVFDNLELDISTEQLTVVLGPSGCGKTTLLRLICGLETADKGKIEIPDNLKLGMMFQEARLMPWLSCRDNVAFGLEEDRQVDELLEMVGLTEFSKLYPKQLSGGMQQRTALARTLAQQSRLILMDEPFSALDYFTRQKLQQELLQIKKATGIGILLVTHDIDEALLLADRIVILQNKGRTWALDIAMEGARDLLEEPLLSYKKQLLQQLAKNEDTSCFK